MIKLNFKKTGMIIAASSAFLAANVMADGHVSTQFYGNIGVELYNTDTKRGTDDDGNFTGKLDESIGGLDLQDGGNRVGFRGTHGNVTGNIEFQITTINDSGVTPRHANVMVDLGNGGTLGIGQQNTVGVVSSGWLSNAWEYYDASLHNGDKYRLTGPRYSGISYKQGFAAGHVAVMVGIDDADDGSVISTSTVNGKVVENKKAQNAIDIVSVGASFDVGPATIKAAFNMMQGDKDENPVEKTGMGLSVDASFGMVSASLGFGQYNADNVGNNKNNEVEKTDIALNLALDLGAVTPFLGVRSVSWGDNGADGAKVPALAKEATDEQKKNHPKEDDEGQTSISLGVNYTLFGGASFFQVDNTTNQHGVDGVDTTRIGTGIAYSF